MTPTIINGIFTDALSKVSEYMQGPVGIIIGSIIGIMLFIVMVGLIMMVVGIFKK